MYQKLTRKQLIEKILGLEQERTSLIKLYLASDNLIKDSTSYISDLWMTRMELEEENKNLKNYIKIPFDVKKEMQNIKAEVRALEEKEKGENSDDRKEIF